MGITTGQKGKDKIRFATLTLKGLITQLVLSF